MSVAATYNLYVEVGTDRTLTLTFKDSEGVAIDITDYSVEAYIAEEYGGTATAAFVGVVTDPTNGVATLTLTDTESAKINYTKGVWVANLIDDSDLVQRVLQGVVTIALDIEPYA